MNKYLTNLACVFFIASLLFACSSGGSSNEVSPPPVIINPPVVSNPPVTSSTDEKIKLNQLGYFTNAVKIAIVPSVDSNEFQLRDTSNNEIVYTGTLSENMTWDLSDSKEFRQADFSSFAMTGNYQIIVTGIEDSVIFEIANNVYDEVHDAAIKAYYFNRNSLELTPEFAGEYARPLGHPDTQVEIHSTAASTQRPAGTKFPSPKGWYDAGDFGKYIVNSGISTYTLLAAFEHYPDFYNSRSIDIPESSNTTPDILDEVMWNLEWMLSMQDPNDGGVYHKLTTLNFSGEQMPHEANEQRYFIQKSTAATLDFAAVMATASRIYSDFSTDYPGKADEFRQAAITAWQWAQANQNIVYSQNGNGVSTGEYGDTQLNDEFAWAAAELFILTGLQTYKDEFFARNVGADAPAWPNVSALAYVSLLNNGQSLLNATEFQTIENTLLASADNILTTYNDSPYKVAMRRSDYVWGSNAVVLNRAWIMLEAYKLNSNNEFLNAAHGAIDYVLGRNPTDYSFVTGFGNKTPMGIHHRQSRADGIAAPIPGFIAGGPQPGQQDGCSYPSSQPALSYLDDWCSYSSNEIAINWNAPLVYVLAALSNL